MNIKLVRVQRSLFALLCSISLCSCSSYQKFKYITEEFEMPAKTFKSDFTQTWQAIIQVLNKYDISKQNREAKVIKTRWMDNTEAVNFADSFGSSDTIKAAKFKLIINLTKGFKLSREVSKVTIYKRQLIEQDFLQGWKEVPSDGITEKTLLYRIQRKIWIDNMLKAIDKKREQEQLKAF